MKGAWIAGEVSVNEWIGIAGIGITILVHIGGTVAFIIRLSNRVTRNEADVDNMKELLKKQATQEGLNALCQKVDLFYTLVMETANQLVNKHVEGEHEYRKSVIAANANVDRLEKQIKEKEKELEALRKQK